MAARTSGDGAHVRLEPIARPRRRHGARRSARLLGVLTITALAVVLVGYCATAAFYYSSTSWIVPAGRTASHAPVAIVPERALGRIAPGAPIYACKLAMLFCHRAGAVRALLPGAVTFEHPYQKASLRGRLIELALDDPAALERDVLFVGGAPLWL